MTLLEALLEQKKHGGDVCYEETFGTGETEFPTGKKVWYQDQLTSDKWFIRHPKPIPFEEAWKLMADGKILQDDYGQLWKMKVHTLTRHIKLYAYKDQQLAMPSQAWLEVELNADLPKFVRVVQKYCVEGNDV